MADNLTFALWLWVNDVIAYTLMQTFLVIMNYKLSSTISKVLLTKNNHLVKALGFYAPDEPRSEWIHIRTCYEINGIMGGKNRELLLRRSTWPNQK